MNRFLLVTPLAIALAACQIGGTETHSAGSASCTPVGSACAQNQDCCSYGCQSGICAPNPVEGGTCVTTDDCTLGHLCKSGACATQVVGMCRDDSDVCGSRYQCCSGDCLGARCTVNRAPVANAGADVPDAPYTQVFTLQNLSSDPDGDPMAFGWSILSAPAGSLAPLSSTTSATPSFTPDKVGTYVVRLVVTDGPAGVPYRLTSQAQVTIVAVNRAPVSTVTAPPPTSSRNVAMTFTGSASDVDGDTIDCQWQVTPPGAGAPVVLAPFASCANPSSPTVQYTPVLEGAYQVDLVVRDHDRTTGSVVNTTVASRTFTSVNDPPTPVVSRAPYYANMGATVGTTPAVVLDASASTDRNGDAPLSYFWEMISASDGGALPALTGFDTATPSFVPDRAVDLVVRVTVTDPAQFARAGASATLDATVHVGHYIQPLAHDVVDAARATAVDKVILGGHDPSDSTKGAIWVYDLATGTEGAKIPLVDPGNATVSGVPRLVAVTPDGTKAVVVDSSVGVSIWIVNLGGASPTMSRIAAPWAVGDLVVAGNRYAYLFKSTGDDYVRELDLTNGSMTQVWAGYGAFGAAYSVSGTTYVYRVDSYFDSWDRYSVGNNGASTTAAAWGSAPSCGGYPSSPATAIWPTLNSTFASSYVLSSCGEVYSASTLGDLTQNVGFSLGAMDSTSNGTVLAADTSGASLRLLNAALALQGTDVLPRWAQSGYGRTAFVMRAFLNSAASKRFAIVSDTATPMRYGVITYP